MGALSNGYLDISYLVLAHIGDWFSNRRVITLIGYSPISCDCMDVLDLGKVGEFHDLREQLKCARDDGLRGYDGCQDRDDQARIEHTRRHGVEEWV